MWLNRIIISTCLNLKKKEKKQKYFFSIDEYEDIIGYEEDEFIPSNYLEDKESCKEILEKIDTLSVKYRTVILLYYYEELTQKEIAEVMDVSENVVEHSLRRARAKMKKEFEQEKFAYKGIPAISFSSINEAMKFEAKQIASGNEVERIITNINYSVPKVTFPKNFCQSSYLQDIGFGCSRKGCLLGNSK